MEAVSNVLLILSNLVTAIVASAAGAFFSKMHRRPDGKCRRHKMQAEYKGFRLGAAEPNWYCSYGGGHYIDRRGCEYEPATEKAAAVGLLAAGVAILASLWRRG
jgi:hypothetical protein